MPLIRSLAFSFGYMGTFFSTSGLYTDGVRILDYFAADKYSLGL